MLAAFLLLERRLKIESSLVLSLLCYVVHDSCFMLSLGILGCCFCFSYIFLARVDCRDALERIVESSESVVSVITRSTKLPEAATVSEI